MELSALHDTTRYCIGSAARGVGCWTYVTLTGRQIKDHWSSTEFRENVLITTTIDVPEGSKWFEVKLPDFSSIVVREHLGAELPALPQVNWDSPDHRKAKKTKPSPVADATPKPSRPAAAVSEVVDELTVVVDVQPPGETWSSVFETSAAAFARQYLRLPATALAG